MDAVDRMLPKDAVKMGPTEVGARLKCDRKTAYRKMVNDQIKSVVVSKVETRTGERIKRVTCDVWLLDYLRRLNPEVRM